MRRTSRAQLLHLLAILFVALPFGFALVRAVTTGTDFRYLWLALATCGGVALVMTLAKARGRTLRIVFALSIVAVVAATLLGRATAQLLGVRAGPAVWIVAAAFALCETAGFALYVLSGPRAARGVSTPT